MQPQSVLTALQEGRSTLIVTEPSSFSSDKDVLITTHLECWGLPFQRSLFIQYLFLEKPSDYITFLQGFFKNCISTIKPCLPSAAKRGAVGMVRQ